MSWQPMSTAPKDGTRFLANNARLGYQPYVVAWHPAQYHGDYIFPLYDDHWGDGDALYFNPNFFTHWQPLPSPPDGAAA